MSKSARLFLSLSEDELNRFEAGREKLGMNRSQYIRYLIGGRKEIRPYTIKYKELISYVASIDMSIKAIAMKDELSDKEKMILFAKIEDIKNIFEKGELLDNLSKGR